MIAVGCSAAVAEDERAASVEQGAWRCDNPPGDYVIAPSSDTAPAYRTRLLQAQLMGYPKQSTCVGPSACNIAPSCAGVTACFAGSCPGWSCGWWGSYTSPDDGRVGARCDMRTEFLTELANPLNTLISVEEKAELTTLRLGCTPFVDFECYDEI